MNYTCMDCDSECEVVIIKDYQLPYGSNPEVLLPVGDVPVLKCFSCGTMMSDYRFADACDAVVKKYLQDKKYE